MRMSCIVIAVLMLCGSTFAVNDLNESFDGAFDLATWGGTGGSNTSFSATSLDFAGAGGNYLTQDYTEIGSSGSWVMKTVWTGIAKTTTSGSAQVNQWLDVDNSGGASDFRVLMGQNGTGNVDMSGQIWDGSSTTISLAVPNVDLGATLPSNYTTWLEFTVNGPGDWQMDYYYDSGSGKTFIGSFADEDLTNSVRLKPLNEFRCLFEEPGEFLLIQAEEITERAPSFLYREQRIKKLGVWMRVIPHQYEQHAHKFQCFFICRDI